MHVTATYR